MMFLSDIIIQIKKKINTSNAEKLVKFVNQRDTLAEFFSFFEIGLIEFTFFSKFGAKRRKR